MRGFSSNGYYLNNRVSMFSKQICQFSVQPIFQGQLSDWQFRDTLLLCLLFTTKFLLYAVQKQREFLYRKVVLREIRTTSDWFFLGRDFAIRTVIMEMVMSCVCFVLKASKFKTSMARLPYNKLLINVACSSHTGEYWPLIIFCLWSFF